VALGCSAVFRTKGAGQSATLEIWHRIVINFKGYHRLNLCWSTAIVLEQNLRQLNYSTIDFQSIFYMDKTIIWTYLHCTALLKSIKVRLHPVEGVWPDSGLVFVSDFARMPTSSGRRFRPTKLNLPAVLNWP
jgi:hypothetical protein